MDAGFAKAATKFSAGPGPMMMQLAFEGLPYWSASEQLKRIAYLYLAPGFDVMSAVYQEAMASLLPHQSVLVVGQSTALDPSYATRQERSLGPGACRALQAPGWGSREPFKSSNSWVQPTKFGNGRNSEP